MRDINFVRRVVDYFNANESTVRATAKHFKISKSTVHIYLTKILPNETSRKILDRNKELRAIRGGEATKRLHMAKKGLITPKEN